MAQTRRNRSRLADWLIGSHGQVLLQRRDVEGEGLEGVEVQRVGRVRLELEEDAR